MSNEVKKEADLGVEEYMFCNITIANKVATITKVEDSILMVVQEVILAEVGVEKDVRV